MSEWQSKTIADLGKVVTGSTPPSRKSNWFGESTPFVTPSDMTEGDRRPRPERWLSAEGLAGLRTRLIPRDSVAFVCIGSIGKVCLLESESVTNQQVNSVIPNANTDGRFLYYLLKHMAPSIAQSASGTATPIINKSTFSQVVVRLPGHATQLRIAAVLGGIDDLIENNRRRIEVLEEMARAIYREWFVKFRYPGHEDVCMINSTLGPIPEDWSVAPLLRVADVRYGRGLAKKEMRPGEVPVYGAAKVIGSHDTATVFERTIVMGCRGSCGQVAITSAPAFVTNNSFTIVPKAGFGKLWLYRFLEHRGVAEFIGGSAQPQITLDSISGLDLYVPNAGLITAFEAAIGPLDAAAWHLGRSSRRLEEIRDQLLPKLVTGQIDVSTLDLDALVSEQVA